MALEGKAQISPEKSPDDYGFKQLSKGVPNSLQTNIYRAFEEAESLIDQLKDTEHGVKTEMFQIEWIVIRNKFSGP